MLTTLFKYLLMDKAGEGGAGGGGGNPDDVIFGTPPAGTPPAGTPPAGTPPAGTPPAGTPPTVTIPENWQDALPPEVKALPFMSKFKDVGTLAKSYAHLETMIGKDKIVIPGANASEAEMREVFQKLGLPGTETDYNFEVKDKEDLDESFLGEFKKQAYGMNILPKQAEKLVNWFNEHSKASYTKAVETQKAAMTADMKKLRTEWGEAFEENTARAKAAILEFLDKDGQEYFKKAGLGANPQIVKLLAKAGSLLSEDKIKGSGGKGGDGHLTPAQALEKLKEFENVKHPYFDASHPGHAAAKKERRMLFDLAYPGQKNNREAVS